MPGYEQPARPLTVFDLLNKAAELNVKVIQIADNLPLDRLPATDIGRLASRAGDLGIQLEVGTSGLEPRHLQNYLNLAERLHSPLLRVVIDSADARPSPEEAVALLQRIVPAFQNAGVSLAIENHDRFPAAKLAEIIERVGSPALGICLDTANSLGCGEDVFTVLKVLHPWVVNVHVKDFLPRRLPHHKGFIIDGCPAGQGALDMPALFAELRRLPHDPNVILELWPPPEPALAESIAKEAAWTRQSIDCLRQYAAE